MGFTPAVITARITNLFTPIVEA